MLSANLTVDDNLHQLKINVVANYFGKAWGALLQLILLPVYISYLGISAYGLIGFYLTLQATLSIFDLGLGTTLNRILAKQLRKKKFKTNTPSIIRTLEYACLVVGSIVILVLIFLVNYSGYTWIYPDEYTIEEFSWIITLMFIAIGVQLPYSLYVGGMNGLNKQLYLNIFRGIIATLQGLGAICVLRYISNSIEGFLIWQILILGLQTLLLAIIFWRLVYKRLEQEIRYKAKFDWRIILSNWRYSIGVTGVTILTIILTQGDRYIVSKLLTIYEFSLYIIAFILGTGLAFLASPISTALFPYFTSLINKSREIELAKLYHVGSQLIALIVFPIGLILAIFPSEVLYIWTGDDKIAKSNKYLLSLVSIGTLLNTSVALAYVLQLAYGWTKLSILKNIIAATLLLPISFFLIKEYGVIGGGISWLILNLAYLLIEIPIMHTKILKKEMKEWYLQDFLKPLMHALLPLIGLRLVLPDNLNRFEMVLIFIMAEIIIVLFMIKKIPKLKRLLNY